MSLSNLSTALLNRESGGNYSAINSLGYIGGYQFGAQALETLGYLKSGASRLGNSALDNISNWTGKNGVGSKQAFLSDPNIQDTALQENFEFNRKVLENRGIIDEDTPDEDVLGYLSAAHLLGAPQVAANLNATDANGVSGREYFQLGKDSFIKLARGGYVRDRDWARRSLEKEDAGFEEPESADSSTAPYEEIIRRQLLRSEQKDTGFGPTPVTGFTDIMAAGFDTTVEQLGVDWEYFKALGNTLLGDEEAAAKNINEARIREEFAAAPLQTVQSFEHFFDEPTVEGFFTQVAKAPGLVAPYIITSITGAGVGALAAVTGKGLLTATNRATAKRLIRESAEKVAKNEATPDEKALVQSAYDVLREYRRTAAGGAIVGAGGAEYVPMASSNLAEALEAGEELDRGTAVRAGLVALPQAAVGVGGEVLVAKHLLNVARKRTSNANSAVGRLAADISKSALRSGTVGATTELIQEGIGVANRIDLDDEYSAQDAQLRLAEAAFMGFFGEGAFGAAGGGTAGAVREALNPNTEYLKSLTSSVLDKSKELVERGRDATVGKVFDKEQYGDIETSLTAPEPESDIQAQLRAMTTDKSSQKNAVWIAGNTPQRGANENGAVTPIVVNGYEAFAAFIPNRGTIISTSRAITQAVVDDGADDKALQIALGYSAVKDVTSGQDVVYQAQDRDGNVVSEELTTAENMEAAQAAATRLMPEGGSVVQTNLQEALERRKKKLDIEQAAAEVGAVKDVASGDSTERSRAPDSADMDIGAEDLTRSTAANPLVREARDSVRDALLKMNFKFVDEENAPDVTDIERIASKILRGLNNDDAAFIKDASESLSYALHFELGGTQRSEATRLWVQESLEQWLLTGKTPTTNQGLWVQLLELYNRLINFFSSDEYIAISDRLENTISDIKTGQDFSYRPKEGYAALSFQSEMDNNPQALQVLLALKEAGISYALTGSVAYADQVPVYRKEGAPLHDVDILLAEEDIPAAQEILSGGEFGGAAVLYEFVPKRTTTSSKGKKILGMAVVPSGYEIRNVATGWRPTTNTLYRNYDVFDVNTNEKVGSYAYEADNYETFEGIAGITVDLMATEGSEVIQQPVTIDGRSETIPVVSYVEGFTAKLGMLRLKDVNDYLAVVPPDPTARPREPDSADIDDRAWMDEGNIDALEKLYYKDRPELVDAPQAGVTLEEQARERFQEDKAEGVQGQEAVYNYSPKKEMPFIYENLKEARAKFESLFGEVNWEGDIAKLVSTAALNRLISLLTGDATKNNITGFRIDTVNGEEKVQVYTYNPADVDLFNFQNEKGQTLERQVPIERFLELAVDKATKGIYVDDSKVTLVRPEGGEQFNVNLADLTRSGQRIVEQRTGRFSGQSREGFLAIVNELLLDGYEIRFDGKTLQELGVEASADSAAARSRWLQKLGVKVSGPIKGDNRKLVIDAPQLRKINDVTAAVVGKRIISIGELLQEVGRSSKAKKAADLLGQAPEEDPQSKTGWSISFEEAAQYAQDTEMEAGLQPEEQFIKDTFEQTEGGRVEWDIEEGEPVLQPRETETDVPFTGVGEKWTAVTKGADRGSIADNSVARFASFFGFTLDVARGLVGDTSRGIAGNPVALAVLAALDEAQSDTPTSQLSKPARTIRLFIRKEIRERAGQLNLNTLDLSEAIPAVTKQQLFQTVSEQVEQEPGLQETIDQGVSGQQEMDIPAPEAPAPETTKRGKVVTGRLNDSRVRKELAGSIVLFGDNLLRRGKGGQAVIRDAPNAFGIPTKRSPGRREQDYFSDKPDEIAAVKEALDRLTRDYSESFLLPEDGIGTGLAQLRERSPQIAALLHNFFRQNVEGYNNSLAPAPETRQTGTRRIQGRAPRPPRETIEGFNERARGRGRRVEPQKNTPVFDDLPSEPTTELTYAGIGARNAPPEILAQMTEVATRLREMGYTLLSGAARGADQAFEAGAGNQKEIFTAKDANDLTRDIAKEIHPSPNNLSEYALDLMARNTNQIFGRDLNQPVSFVLTWTPDGVESSGARTQKTGGTGQAIDMASRKGIPVINMYNEGWQNKLENIISAEPESADMSDQTPPSDRDIPPITEEDYYDVDSEMANIELPKDYGIKDPVVLAFVQELLDYLGLDIRPDIFTSELLESNAQYLDYLRHSLGEDKYNYVYDFLIETQEARKQVDNGGSQTGAIGRTIYHSGKKSTILLRTGIEPNPLIEIGVAFHEIGHALWHSLKEDLLKNSPEIVHRLYDDFREHASYDRYMTLFASDEDFQFQRAFHEFFADQVAKAGSKKFRGKKPKNIAKKIYADFAAKLRAYWRKGNQLLKAYNLQERMGGLEAPPLDREFDPSNPNNPLSADFEIFLDAVIKRNKEGEALSSDMWVQKTLVKEMDQVNRRKMGPQLEQAVTYIKNLRDRIIKGDEIKAPYALFATADSYLRLITGKVGDKIANIFYLRAQEARGGEGEGSLLGMIGELGRQRDRLNNKFIEMVGQPSDQTVLDALEEAYSSFPDNVISEKARQVRAFYKWVYDSYIEPSNSRIKQAENYTPTVLDLEKISLNPDEFINLVLTETNQLNNPEARVLVKKAVVELIQEDEGVLDHLQESVWRMNPQRTVEKQRVLTAGIAPQKLRAFSRPPIEAHVEYVKNLTRRVEWNRHTKNEQSQDILRPLLEQLSPENRDKTRQVIEVYLGYQKSPMSPFWRGVNSWAQVIQFYMTIPFAVLASLTEFAGPMIRSKEFTGLIDGYRTIISTIKDKREAEILARDLGIISTETVATVFLTEADRQFMTEGARNASDAFFKYTGLSGFTRFTRIFASKMAINFVIRHSDPSTMNENSLRYLEELDITPEDVKAWLRSDRNMETDEGKKVGKAISRFVEDSILRPNVAERPLWASDPRFALIWQLKGFFWSYGKVIMAGVAREARTRLNNGETVAAGYTATAALLAIAAVATFPLAMFGMELREYAKFGLAAITPGIESSNKYFRSDKMDWPTYMAEIMDRSGIYGPFTILAMMQQKAEWGKSPITPVFGPTAEMVETIIENGFDVGKTVRHRLLPIVNQI